MSHMQHTQLSIKLTSEILEKENQQLKQALAYAEDNFEEVYIPVYPISVPASVPTSVPTTLQKNKLQFFYFFI